MTLTELRREAEIAQHDHDIVDGWWAGLVEAKQHLVNINPPVREFEQEIQLAGDKEYDTAKYYALVRDVFLSKIGFPIVSCTNTGESSFF